jgi:hypothetical protein
MPYPWKPFLETWSAALVQSPYAEDYDLPAEVIQSGWLGYEGATQAQIEAAEARLGRRLPPSYREFLQVTNGWRTTGTFIDKMWSVEAIDWFPARNQGWIDIQAEFPDAIGEDENSFPPVAHLRAALEISDMGDAAIYLLNPLVVRPDGEWQAIFMASWLPGARRYPSFWDMMQGEYRTFANLDAREQKRYRASQGEDALPRKVGGLIELLREEMAPIQGGPATSQDVMRRPYFEGWIEALQDAIGQVQKVIDRNLAPAALMEALWTLSGDLDQEGLNLDRQVRVSAQKALAGNWLDLLRRSPSIQQESGAAIGKKKAAATIRWFLGQG